MTSTSTNISNGCSKLASATSSSSTERREEARSEVTQVRGTEQRYLFFYFCVLLSNAVLKIQHDGTASESQAINIDIGVQADLPPSTLLSSMRDDMCDG